MKLGAGLGLSGLDEVFGALRDSAGTISPADAIREATVAVRRAEARAAEFFPQPLPPPCEVTPMPEVVAVSGAAPHYTPPRLDGGAAGDVLVQHRTAHRRDRMGHRGGGLPRGGARASSAALPPPAAHRPARPPAPAQPLRVLGGLGPVRRAARRGGRAVRRRPRPARLDQHVADAGRPAGGGHRPALLRLEPGAGPGVPGRSRPDAAGVPGRRGGPVRGRAGAGSVLSHRQARDHPDPGGRPAAPGTGVLAARLPRRRPGPRLAADAGPGAQHRGLAGPGPADESSRRETSNRYDRTEDTHARRARCRAVLRRPGQRFTVPSRSC